MLEVSILNMKNSKEKEEIALGISLLKKNGIKIELTEDLKQQLNDNILFNGNDILFKKLINNSKTYLEYGSGKSTLWTLRNTNNKIYSIETDSYWKQKIFDSVSDEEDERLNLKLIDIGPVKNFGRPISYFNYKNFYEYTDYYWKKNIQPDFILIDGRFRVCSFLSCLKYAKEGTPILFDDYTERKFYHIVEELISVHEYNENQALFVRPKKNLIDHNKLNEMIKNFRFVVD